MFKNIKKNNCSINKELFIEVYISRLCDTSILPCIYINYLFNDLAIRLLTELGMPWLVVEGVKWVNSWRSSSNWATWCVFVVGGGLGGNGGGDRLCMDKDLRDGRGGGTSPLQLLKGE